MLTRRLFLHGLLGAAGAALFVPVERKLWPGADLVIPPLFSPPTKQQIEQWLDRVEDRQRYFLQIVKAELALAG